MPKYATVAVTLLSTLSIGLATPAHAAPSGPDKPPRPPVSDGRDAHPWAPEPGQNAYGGYQNDTKRQSPARR